MVHPASQRARGKKDVTKTKQTATGRAGSRGRGGMTARRADGGRVVGAGVGAVVGAGGRAGRPPRVLI